MSKAKDGSFTQLSLWLLRKDVLSCLEKSVNPAWHMSAWYFHLDEHSSNPRHPQLPINSILNEFLGARWLCLRYLNQRRLCYFRCLLLNYLLHLLSDQLVPYLFKVLATILVLCHSFVLLSVWLNAKSFSILHQEFPNKISHKKILVINIWLIFLCISINEGSICEHKHEWKTRCSET